MESVRAKFKCDSIENYEHSKTAKFSAVNGTTEENKDFSNYTPNGQLSISITNETPAAEFFEPGQSYYLTFQKAEK